jgi:glyoxylase I family protein
VSAGHRLTHIGLCVRDIERSAAFYCAALGFNVVGRMVVQDDASARLLDLPGLILHLVYLERDGFRLELLGYATPGTSGNGTPRAMNALGFTHLSFRVDNPDRLVEKITRLGGRLHGERTTVFGAGNRGLMLTDPDGNWLELIERLPSAEED